MICQNNEMKSMFRKYMLASLMIVSCIINTQAQSPQKMSYQAVIRNSDNQLVVNRTVRMRISLLPDSMTATASYVETHQVTTNALGAVQLEIGGGTVVSGNFAAIPWSSGKIFIKTETDPAGGTNYSLASTKQLMSVPYALYANDVPITKIGDTVSIGSSRLVIPGATLLPGAAMIAGLSSGLVAHYPFNGNANDVSGNGNNGVVNGATLSVDRYGKANSAYGFKGHGSNNHIKVPNSNTLKFKEMSVSIWYKVKSPSGMDGNGNLTNFGNQALFSKEGDGIGTPGGFFGEITFRSNGGYLGYFNNNGCCDTRRKQDSVAAYSHLMSLSDTSWRHAVFVSSNIDFKIYVDGKLVKTKSLLQDYAVANTVNLYFGIYGSGGDSQDRKSVV
jgi:hypothetical protein